MTEAELDDKLSNVRGAVMMAYPMGLPSWDTMKKFLGTIEDMQVRVFCQGLHLLQLYSYIDIDLYLIGIHVFCTANCCKTFFALRVPKHECS